MSLLLLFLSCLQKIIDNIFGKGELESNPSSLLLLLLLLYYINRTLN